MQWNGLDIVLGVLILFFILRGLFRGFVKEAFSVGTLVLGFFAASMFGPNFAPVIENILNIPGWGTVVSFLGIFLVVYTLLKFIEKLFRGFIESFKLQNLDKALGFILGVGEGLIVITLLVWVLRIQPLIEARPWIEGSWIIQLLNPIILGIQACLRIS